MWAKISLVILFCIQYGLSIRCFDCNSANNSMCLNPHLYDPDSVRNFIRVTECRQGVLTGNPETNLLFFCRKIQQTILHKHYEPEIRVTRGCGWKRSYHECYRADNEDHLETVCQCFTDECNAGNTLTTSCLASVLRMLAVFAIIKLF